MAKMKKPSQGPNDANSATSLATGPAELMSRVVGILDQARANVAHAVNSNMVLAYWLIGREIVTALQGGEQRADYGTGLIDALATALTQRYGRGFSATNLKYFRLFFQTYAMRQPEIRHERRDESGSTKFEASQVHRELTVALAERDTLQGFSSRLSWTHYRTLCRIEQPAERLFYEIEAARNGWSQPELERQMHSHLFLRLIRSQDKAGVMELAAQGQRIERPVDAIKHPYVLDFLDLPDAPRLHESDLESALMDKLQPFLLELGKGFAFVARQHRIGTEHQHFYIDLVFYNYLLKCFVLVDLKMGKLSHQDVGQMDMYVRMFDDLRRSESDGPTVGLILCAERDEVVVRYSVLHESQQLFAAKYMLVLPSEEELRCEIERERALLESAKTPDRDKDARA